MSRTGDYVAVALDVDLDLLFQISMNKIARPEENRGQITPITGKSESERQLTSMIMDMQTKNGKISSWVCLC